MFPIEAEVIFLPHKRSVKVRVGTTVLQAARKAGIAIVTRCGGNASCFMCKVNIADCSGLGPMNDNERRKLAGLEGTGTRLACQAVVKNSVTVELPADPLRAAIARQLQKQKEEDSLW